MLRLADGDRSAFDEVYGVVAPRVDGLCRRLLGPGPDAEDAAQQALMQVFARVSSYDPQRGPALPWVLGIAAWEARSVRRRLARRREDPLPERPLASLGPDPEGCAVQRSLDQALMQVVEGMSPMDRQTVLVMLEHQQRPPVAASTYRKRVQRALARLKIAFGGLHG